MRAPLYLAEPDPLSSDLAGDATLLSGSNYTLFNRAQSLHALRNGRHRIFASVVFLKIQDFARRSATEQARLRAQLQAVVAVTAAEIPPAGRVMLDSADGAAIVVLDDPRAALRLAERALTAVAAGLPLSAGLNHGALQLAGRQGRRGHDRRRHRGRCRRGRVRAGRARCWLRARSATRSPSGAGARSLARCRQAPSPIRACARTSCSSRTTKAPARRSLRYTAAAAVVAVALVARRHQRCATPMAASSRSSTRCWRSIPTGASWCRRSATDGEAAEEDRPLQDSRRAWPRRDGRGVQGRGPEPRPGGGAEDHHPRQGRRGARRVPEALPDRGQGGRQAQPSEHRHHLRLRRGRRHGVPGDGAARGHRPAQARAAGADPGDRGGGDRAARSPRAWPTRTSAASCIATSSRPTSCCPTAARRRSWTSAWRACASPTTRPAPASCSARRATCRPSRSPASRSTSAPTSSRSASWCGRCSPASGLFSGTEMPQVSHSITYDEHVPPTRINPELPSMLDFVVARALKKDPAVRYQDADEMAADLHTCLAELRGRAARWVRARFAAARRSSSTPTASRPSARRRRATSCTDTRLPVSRHFDSTAALRRLAQERRGGPRRHDRWASCAASSGTRRRGACSSSRPSPPRPAATSP